MPVINGVYLKDFPALPSAVTDANIIPIAISGNQIAYRTTVAGIVTDARVTSKLLTGLSVTGSTILATDTILQAFGKVQNQLNGKVSSVGLTMPAAFNVANSPITSAGTLAVTAAGVASQYIRGDGALADFPTTGGGGSSVSYYLNGSVSQGTIGGNTYYEMNKTPVIGTGTDFSIGADGYIAQFITDANDPASLLIPGGNWNVEMYFSASSSGGTPSFYVEVYKYDGSTFTLLGSSATTPEGITNGTAIDIYYTSVGIPETVLTITDRLAIRVYVTHSGRTITLHTEDNHLSEIVTTFSNGLTALNGLTKQTQYFAVGTTGTDFNISSSVDTHTFNIPDASATARGLINIGSQTIGGDKILTSASSNPTLSLRNTGAGRKFEIKDSGGGNILYVDYIGQTYILGNLTIGGGNTFDMGQTMLATGASYFASSLSVTRTLSTNSYYIAFRTGATQVTATPNWYAGNFTGNNDFEISSYNGSSVQTTFKINSTTNLVTLLGGISATTANFTGQLTLGSTITNGTYTYTLPSATGTLALTSALSSYLPLSGGTLTGAIQMTGGVFPTTGAGLEILYYGGASYLQSYSRTSSAFLPLSILGSTLSFTGAATFSSTIQSGGDISLMNASGDISLRMKDSGGNADRVVLRQATTNDVYVGDIDANGGQLILRANGNNNLTIASTGAATFSSSVKIGTNTFLGIDTTDGADNGYLALCGAGADGATRGGHIYLSGNERSTDAGSIVIATGNTTSGTGATAATVFRNAGSETMRITSGGNVQIGGTTNNNGNISINSTNPVLSFGTSSSGPDTALVGTAGGANYHITGSATGDFCIRPIATGNLLFGTSASTGAASNIRMTIAPNGSVTIAGSLSKGSGSFRIAHPLPSLSKTHQLVHSFIEGPQADLIYRGKLTLVNGKAQANIDEVSTMTEGTFEVLCREVQCFTTNESGWDLVKGKVIGNIIYIESQNENSTDEISWMVIGERKDKHMMDTEWTDENGKVIVEPLKPIEPEPMEEIEPIIPTDNNLE